MNTKAPLKGRSPSFVVIGGVECALVPLGKEGKYGTFMCEKADWDSYLFRGFSPNLTVNNSGVVVTTHRSSRRGRSNNVTFASLIMPDRKGHRIHYEDRDRRNLRRSNISYRKGRGRAYEHRHNVPDPRKGKRSVPTECIADEMEAAQRKELMTSGKVAVSMMGLPTDGSEWTLENILETYDWEEEV